MVIIHFLVLEVGRVNFGIYLVSNLGAYKINNILSCLNKGHGLVRI
jgi:hypothetical protein